MVLTCSCSGAAAFVPRTTKNAARSLVHFMFTGIVEEMGIVVSMEERDDLTLWDGTKGKGTELVVQGKVVLEDAYLGYAHKENYGTLRETLL
jgi:hypothetical protein